MGKPTIFGNILKACLGCLLRGGTSIAISKHKHPRQAFRMLPKNGWFSQSTFQLLPLASLGWVTSAGAPLLFPDQLASQCMQFEGVAFTSQLSRLTSKSNWEPDFRSIYKQSHLNLNIFVPAYNTGLHICTKCTSHQDTPFVCTSTLPVSALALNARHVTEKSRVILNFLSAP